MNDTRLRRTTLALIALTLGLTGILTLALGRPSQGQTRVTVACSTGLVGSGSSTADQVSTVSLRAVNTNPLAVQVRLRYVDEDGGPVAASTRTIPPQATALFHLPRTGLVRVRGIVQILDGASDFNHVIVTMDYSMYSSSYIPQTNDTIEHCQPV
jgi:hypothetical protein